MIASGLAIMSVSGVPAFHIPFGGELPVKRWRGCGLYANSNSHVLKRPSGCNLRISGDECANLNAAERAATAHTL